MSALKNWLAERRASWVAQQLGVSPNTVANWRRGGRVRQGLVKPLAALTGLSESVIPISKQGRTQGIPGFVRAKAFGALYSQGYTLQEIGTRYGITRERVRQVLREYTDIAPKAGGRAKQSALKRQADAAACDARYIAKYGMTHDEWKACVAAGGTCAFIYQKRTSKSRGIGFEMNLRQWWDLWQASGKWEQRGRGRGHYCMARIRDTGPYAIGNVQIVSIEQNAAEARYNNPTKRHADPAERGIYFLYPNHSKPWSAKYGNKSLGLYATKEEAASARAVFLNSHAKNFALTVTHKAT